MPRFCRCGSARGGCEERDACNGATPTARDGPRAPVPVETGITIPDILHGDCREVLPSLRTASVQCVVTSPPYWGLRDYGVAGQLGLERTPEDYVRNLVAVFDEVRRVLREDGTLWLNLGDTYKAKQLAGIPWRVAFALQAAGWFLRSDIVWSKTNPTPESVRDRPTRSHEYVFLLTKSPRYVYDADAVREPHTGDAAKAVARGQRTPTRRVQPAARRGLPAHQRTQFAKGHSGYFSPEGKLLVHPGGRNARTVWELPSATYPGAHFATFPEELARRCIEAGSRVGDVVLDPFAGAGTVGLVAKLLGRPAVLVELHRRYLDQARARIASAAPSDLAKPLKPGTSTRGRVVKAARAMTAQMKPSLPQTARAVLWDISRRSVQKLDALPLDLLADVATGRLSLDAAYRRTRTPRGSPRFDRVTPRPDNDFVEPPGP